MIKYRPHRGSLDKALEEYQEFTDIADMLKYISKQWDGYLDIKDIVIGQSYGEDDRIGWKSWRHVCITKIKICYEYDGSKYSDYKHYDTPQCIGMCDLGELG